jgi:hypothetical protein
MKEEKKLWGKRMDYGGRKDYGGRRRDYGKD